MPTFKPIDSSLVLSAVSALESSITDIRKEIFRELEHIGNDAAVDAAQLAPIRRVFKGSRRIVRPISRERIAAEAKIRQELGVGGSVERTQGSRQAQRRMESRMATRSFGKNPYDNPNDWRHAIRAREIVGPTMTVPLVLGQPQGSMRTFLTPPERMRMRSRLAHAKLRSEGRWELKNARQVGFGTLEDTPDQIKKQRTAVIRIGNKFYLGGRLKASIKPLPLESAGAHKERAWVIAGAYYAKYVEYGTRHAAAQPFMRPALKKQQMQYNKRMARAIKAATVKRRGTPFRIEGGKREALGGKTGLQRSTFGQDPSITPKG